MKLASIARHGEERGALVLGATGDACQYCLDLKAAKQLLGSQPSLGWKWAAPPSSVLDIVRQGQAALDLLRKLHDFVQGFLDKGDGAALGDALVAGRDVVWRPPIPRPPLFMVFHGNSAYIWRNRTQVSGESRAIITRVPVPRLRPFTALIGHNEPVLFPEGSPLGFGNEPGFVIAPGGRNISFADAERHLWGITNCNDLSRSLAYTTLLNRPKSEMAGPERDSVARLGKAGDAVCPVGPWITTIDEIPNIYDLLVEGEGPQGIRERSHTSGYLKGPDNYLAYFSRFMTVPAGSIFQMGAPGKDGAGGYADVAKIDGKCLRVFTERLGTLVTPVQNESRLYPGEALNESRWRRTYRRAGLRPENELPSQPPRVPESTTSLWVVQMNHAACAKEGYDPAWMPVFSLLPRTALAAEGVIELSAAAGELVFTCELAAVIGPQAAFRIPEDDFERCLLGYVPMIGVHDRARLEELPMATPYEAKFAQFIARCGDGHNHIGVRIVPVAEVGDIHSNTMRVALEGFAETLTMTADYRWRMGRVLSVITRETSLLPGDIVSLGPAGHGIIVPRASKLPADAHVCAEILGLGMATATIVDHRGTFLPLREIM